MLIPVLKTLSPKPLPPPDIPFASVSGGVAVIFQLGEGWCIETPGGRMKCKNPQHLIRAARKMGTVPTVE